MVDLLIYIINEWCFLLVDEICLQVDIALEGLATQYLHCRLDDEVASRGVGGRGIDCTLGDGLHTIVGAGQAIDAHDKDPVAKVEFLHSPACTDGHLVVLGQDDAYAGMFPQAAFGLNFSLVLVPCTHALIDLVAAADITYRSLEALVTEFHRRRTRQTQQFEHLATLGQHHLEILSLQTAHLVVVTAYEGRIFVASHLAVGHDDGDARIEGPRHSGCQRVGTVGRNDEQIDVLPDEVVDVACLSLIVVIGRAHFEGDTRVEQQFTAHLLVEFVAPGIVAALRHADAVVGSGGFPARHDAQGDGQQGQKYNNKIKMSFHDGIILFDE